jgi:hypothetical protein
MIPDNFAEKSTIKCLLVHISILLFTASCQKQEISYFPLNAEHAWHYNINVKTVQGSVKQKEIINNLGLEKPNNEDVFIKNSITGILSYFVKNSDSIYLKYKSLADQTPVTQTHNLTTVFKYPLITGTQWQDTITTSLLKSYDNRARDVIEAIPVTATIESMNDVIRVPAGKYINCIRILTSGEKYIPKGKYAYQPDMNIKIVNTRWYAPGVGLVKELQLESSDVLQYPEGNFVKTLTKFY